MDYNFIVSFVKMDCQVAAERQTCCVTPRFPSKNGSRWRHVFIGGHTEMDKAVNLSILYDEQKDGGYPPSAVPIHPCPLA
ncbi:hypothetical protein [Cohnella nanjingensis]|nr:hypothetical protein [Cohnella nanjingensis]